MNNLYFEKHASFERKNEPVKVSIPFAKGEVKDINTLRIHSENGSAVSQSQVLGNWDDGSVKWAKVDFLADLPANKSKMYHYDFSGSTTHNPGVAITENGPTLIAYNGCIRITLNNTPGEQPIHSIEGNGLSIGPRQISGPYIMDCNNQKHFAVINSPWSIEDHGPVMTKLSAAGSHYCENGNKFLDFILTITIYANTPWFEVGYRIINRDDFAYVYIKKIALSLLFNSRSGDDFSIATSNYGSNIRTTTQGAEDLYTAIDADYLINDANEQIPEVFYGTFFADWNNKENGGICATHYQAYQNFPKALRVGGRILSLEFLPENHGLIKYYRGMAKSHTFFLHLHPGDEDIQDINKRSLMLQQMDRPILPPAVYEKSGCFPGIFANRKWIPFDSYIMALADNRGKSFGFLHWGDHPDSGYSQQGRGGGDYIWTNNEYDFPLAAMQLYARSGERRVLDYALTAGAHLVDIDICHSSSNPLMQGAQIEHCRDHVFGNAIICHMWVEGLFAYYYQTGDKFAYDTAIELGHNIIRHLKQPRYQQKGMINARETGWALRALTALYQETGEENWLQQAESIVSHFVDWKEAYGGFVSPYTDHTLVRVPFMISVAVCSLMRYYRVRPDDIVKNMIIDAMDDLIENALLENGLFYYKESASLRKPGFNTIVLEALAYAYQLTGDEKYLQAGIPTFAHNIRSPLKVGRKKDKIKDGVLQDGPGPKAFAQGFYPLTVFFCHASKTKIMEKL
ncbi:MAG: glycoside hydrolase family 127 protein [Defluviitaleaceae bacterium]|nr:glycoside hydrolase family 127 protein [Defluviitaleaceae bacterium]